MDPVTAPSTSFATAGVRVDRGNIFSWMMFGILHTVRHPRERSGGPLDSLRSRLDRMTQVPFIKLYVRC